MPIFTFITDFRGGTYICQKTAADLRTACFLWKEDIVSGGYVQHLDVAAFSEAFDADIDELPPVNGLIPKYVHIFPEKNRCWEV